MKAYEEHWAGCPRLKDVRADCLCPTKAEPYAEMTSLKEIKAKLDTILDRTAALEYVGRALDALDADMCGKLDTIAESQGKLLAALNALGEPSEQELKDKQARNTRIEAMLKREDDRWTALYTRLDILLGEVSASRTPPARKYRAANRRQHTEKRRKR